MSSDAGLPRLEDVDPTDYDFLDFGAGRGDSIERCQKLFGGRGLGIDIDPKKIRAAAEAGREVVLGDVYSLPRRPIVRYVCLDNVLEHLFTMDEVEAMLSVAADVASEFLYIVHPSFEDEAYLASLGFRQYWSYWRGHRTHVLLSDFFEIFRRLELGMAEVRYIKPSRDSSDGSILPLGLPIDQHRYDPAVHGPKPHVEFAKPVFGQIQLLVPTKTAGNLVRLPDVRNRAKLG